MKPIQDRPVHSGRTQKPISSQFTPVEDIDPISSQLTPAPLKTPTSLQLMQYPSGLDILPVDR